MKLPRRQFLHLAAGTALLPAAARLARAQSYPTRPLHIVVGFGAGTGLDLYARIIGQWLSERLGQAVIIDNRPGAGTNLATEAVVNAAPDGYTLLMASTAAFTNPALYDNLRFNFIRDIVPVASLSRGTFVMVVDPSFPAKTVPEFIAYAKANPGKVNMASGGIGTTNHVAGELLKAMAGIDMVHVPYRSDGAVITDLIGGRVQVYFVALAGAAELHQVRQAAGARGDHRASGRRRSRKSRPSAKSCRVTRPACATAWARPRAHPPTSSLSSTQKSMPASTTRKSKRNSPRSAPKRCR